MVYDITRLRNDFKALQGYTRHRIDGYGTEQQSRGEYAQYRFPYNRGRKFYQGRGESPVFLFLFKY